MLSSTFVLRVLRTPDRPFKDAPTRSKQTRAFASALTALIAAWLVAAFGVAQPYTEAALKTSAHAVLETDVALPPDLVAALDQTAATAPSAAAQATTELSTEAEPRLQTFDASNFLDAEIDAAVTEGEGQEGPDKSSLALPTSPHLAAHRGRSCWAPKPHQWDDGGPPLEWLHAQHAPRGPPARHRSAS